MTYSRDTTAISEITGQPVSTWSVEWQYECEARAVLKMSKSEQEAFFNGSSQEGASRQRGVLSIRGPKAVEELRAWMRRLEEARYAKAL